MHITLFLFCMMESCKDYPRFVVRFIKIFKRIKIYLGLIVMVYMQIFIENNIISCVFMTLMLCNSLDLQLRIVISIKHFCQIILIIFIGFDHNYLENIGLRSQESVLVYFLLAICFETYFEEMKGVSLREERFLEDDYKKLF